LYNLLQDYQGGTLGNIAKLKNFWELAGAMYARNTSEDAAGFIQNLCEKFLLLYSTLSH